MKKESLDYLDMKQKYKNRLASELGDKPKEISRITTQDYETFKQTFLPKRLSYYEKAAVFSEKILPIKPDKKSIPDIEEALRISHLNISPTAVYSFTAMVSIGIILSSILFGFIIPYIITQGSFDSFFFVFFGFIMAAVMLIPLSKLPFIISNQWRMKASNQMVLSIFYIVTFMRHTPNLELAIDFAAEHLSPPLSLDFKKVIWDIETNKFDNVTESLDYYLQSWRKFNPEFIESIHLIESSLYESSEDRRQNALDKSLQVILDETYEKMLHYTHDLKGPITTLHMLGIILPILGLVILPMVVAFIPEARWYHLFAFYNVLLPVLVYYLGREILSNRPTGYGGSDTSELSPLIEKDKITVKFKGGSEGINVTPTFVGILIFAVLFFVGISPLLINMINPDLDIALTENGIIPANEVEEGVQVYGKLLDYRTVSTETGPRTDGPYGLGASLLSLGLPLSFGLGLGYYYKLQTSGIVNIRARTKELEQEFASALFQLGNRLGDGIPAEIAFSSVANVMRGTNSGKFFELVSNNIVKLGVGVEAAIFDKDYGALKQYPSSIIESSMKVFLESSKKGPLIASQALLTVAEYIKSMHRVDERLKDLMADIISNMKSQISFLTPTISGIVVGITSMISQIIGSLGERLTGLGGVDAPIGGAGLLEMFGGGGIPTYYFQAIVGLYVVQITYILSVMINGIQNGTDRIGEKDIVGKSLINSTMLYVGITSAFTIIFSVIASIVIGTL